MTHEEIIKNILDPYKVLEEGKESLYERNEYKLIYEDEFNKIWKVQEQQEKQEERAAS